MLKHASIGMAVAASSFAIGSRSPPHAPAPVATQRTVYPLMGTVGIRPWCRRRRFATETATVYTTR